MQRRSAIDSSRVPPALLTATPRRVRVNQSGGMMLVSAAALVVVGLWGGIEFTRHAAIANRRVGLFTSERIVTGGDVIELRKRGGGDDHRIIAHYRYLARGRELTGETTLRRAERQRYAVGAPVAIWYLPTDPEMSWLDGYAPRPQPGWPGTAVPLACGVCALALNHAVRRQSTLLAHGRPAMATVTKVEKKNTGEGTVWLVHYEWTTLSGATRSGKYRHGKKHMPAAGALIPLVYDKDNSFRHSKYPMSLVTIRT